MKTLLHTDGIGKILGPAIDMIPWKGSSATHINYVTPFAITATLNVSQFVM